VKGLLMCIALTVSAASITEGQSPVEAIHRLDSLWAQMYQTHDTATARKLYADDLIWTTVDGNVKDKRAELADVAPAAGLVMDYFRTSRVAIRVPPDTGTAVVTGLAEWKFTVNRRSREVARRYTHVYVHGGPLGWQILAVHMGQAPGR
jgi:ketosteroid isomerase-like protein